MARILLLDEDLDGFIEYVREGLAEADLEVRGYKYLGDAHTVVSSDSEEFDAAVVDIMLPIRKEDDAAFHDLVGRSPREDDAMWAGTYLIPLLNKKEIPVFIITHLNNASSLGRRVLAKLTALRKE